MSLGESIVNQDNRDKITDEEYVETIKKVLLAKPKSKYENRMPTKKELKLRWKLVKE